MCRCGRSPTRSGGRPPCCCCSRRSAWSTPAGRAGAQEGLAASCRAKARRPPAGSALPPPGEVRPPLSASAAVPAPGRPGPLSPPSCLQGKWAAGAGCEAWSGRAKDRRWRRRGCPAGGSGGSWEMAAALCCPASPAFSLPAAQGRHSPNAAGALASTRQSRQTTDRRAICSMQHRSVSEQRCTVFAQREGAPTIPTSAAVLSAAGTPSQAARHPITWSDAH